MELIELDATAQRALELLTNAGMSDGSIYDYTHTGFGSILRHFHAKSILYATAEMLDNFCWSNVRFWTKEISHNGNGDLSAGVVSF